VTQRAPRGGAGAMPAGIQPREEHGQNFLMTREVLLRSCEYAELSREDAVLEVGPGPGNLTALLAERAGSVCAIEIDRQFEPALTRLQAQHANLRLLWGDALALDFPPFSKLVSNLPYKPALPLIMKLLEHDFTLAVVVIQQRLARRLAARPGQEGYSRISVTVQRVASPRLLEVIRPHHFVPPPAVDSAMLRLRKTRPRFAVPDPDELRRLLDVLFLSREQPVAAALGQLGELGDPGDPGDRGDRRDLGDRGRAAPGSAVARVVAALPAELAGRRVALVTPEEFGLIARQVHACGVAVPEVPDEIKRKAQKYFGAQVGARKGME
jgi:16S rRNA (adenine1518-N6/adenine1519-N6)-dimethyltransferase